MIVRDGSVVGAGHNERELRGDPTAHAEMLALREASAALGCWRLLDTVLYVTLEPCAMCAGAIVLARVPRVVYGTTDPKAGAAGSVLDVLGEPRLNHRPEVAGGLLAEESRGAAPRRSSPRGARRVASLPAALGGVPEWLNGAVSKTVAAVSSYRGFESLPLRLGCASPGGVIGRLACVARVAGLFLARRAPRTGG